MQVQNMSDSRRREVFLLNSLHDDLAVLESAWQKKKISPQKAAKHLNEIMQSVEAIAKTESLERFEMICAETRKKLDLVENKKAHLDKRHWALISELVELIKSSLNKGNGAAADAETRKEDSKAKPVAVIPANTSDEPPSMEPPSIEPPSMEPPSVESSSVESPRVELPSTETEVDRKLPPREENQMNKDLQANAKELLQRAQEALLSGNGENAKELAMQAAELISKLESEEAKKKEKGLRADFEFAVHEEAEAEETLTKIKEEMADSENEIHQLNEKFSEARTSFTEQQQTCQQVKEQIENVESEITRLNEERKTLLSQFQEALPARDAAERECLRLKVEVDKLTPEFELITDSARSAEDQLAKARQKREALEAELNKTVSKISV
jgi:chromosome segregation ATPase